MEQSLQTIGIDYELWWKHDEQMAYYDKWNGASVSAQSVYVPNTYDLKNGK